MICTHPLTGVITGNFNEKGNREIVIVDKVVDGLVPFESVAKRLCRKGFKVHNEYGALPISYLTHGKYIDNHFYFNDLIDIPCGKCIACRLNYARNWSIRCYHESLLHPFNYFLTLTYDDDNVVWLENDMTLYKKDFQDFIKRLRYHLKKQGFNEKISYFMCGEYGEHTHRPHYHVILFNMPELTDLKPIKKSLGNILYTSKFITDIWQKGNISIGSVTAQSSGYTARYTLKKQTKYDVFTDDVLPEFSLCSRKPPIGVNYFLKNFDTYLSQDSMTYYDGDKVLSVPIPVAYLKFAEKTKDLKLLKALREYKSKLLNSVVDYSGYTYSEYVQKQDFVIKSKIENSLFRKEV